MRKVLFFLLLSFTLHALSLTENGKLKPAAEELIALFDVPLNEWLQTGREVWEMDGRFEDKRPLAYPLLKELQCIDSIRAKKEHYDYALVLGATGPAMNARLNFLYAEWERGVRFDQIVLLTGARDLDAKVEMIPEGLQTETELFVYLFNEHPLSKIAVPLVIDAPKRETLRPNTESTVVEWLKTSPAPGSCLVISTQPFVGRQEAVLRSILPKSFDVEAIGPRMEQIYPLSIYLDNFAKWLMYEQKEPPSEYLPYPSR